MKNVGIGTDIYPLQIIENYLAF